jgi:hypothetical protein
LEESGAGEESEEELEEEFFVVVGYLGAHTHNDDGSVCGVHRKRSTRMCD